MVRRESDREGFWEEREGEGRGRRQERANGRERHIYRFPVGEEGEAAPEFGFEQIYHSRVGSGPNLRSRRSGSVRLSVKVQPNREELSRHLNSYQFQIAWGIGGGMSKQCDMAEVNPPSGCGHSTEITRVRRIVAREPYLGCISTNLKPPLVIPQS